MRQFAVMHELDGLIWKEFGMQKYKIKILHELIDRKCIGFDQEDMDGSCFVSKISTK